MRRDPMPLLLILVLALLGSVAWLTRDPDHPALDWLARQPVVGPAAERFRDAYRGTAPRPAAAAPEAEAEGAAPGIAGRGIAGREVAGPRASTAVPRPLGRAWLAVGTELRREPDPASAVVARLEGLRMMAIRERRGGWCRVARAGLGGSLTEGWVPEADLGEPSAEELWQPEPVVPLAAVAPAAAILAEARGLMGTGVRESPCGPYLLLTDVAGPLAETCPRLAGQLEGLYAARTGLAPVGRAAEAIFVFDSRGAYMVFRTRISPESRRHAFAAPARGFVAVAGGGKRLEQVQETVVHELVHLLNRRFLGPALPSWLDEGLAEDLAMSQIAADGTLAPGSLGRWEEGSPEARRVGGGQVVLGELRAWMRGGELPSVERLVGLDSAAFQDQAWFEVHYALSGFWVRYLLGGGAPAGAEGFRAFLAAVAAGEPLTEDLLLSSLGAGWPELESGFRRWLIGLEAQDLAGASVSGSSSRQAEEPSA